mmetsp:Transcript_6175/g.9632  ORF Transcript_6175/g.9632 Transcript_6175/m.9632 type:complete len:374 (-) Transcript_6175:61-1182(-)
MGERIGHFSNRVYTKEEHHEWALKLWERIDRDHSGSVTQQELNCDEFQDVLHAVIAPENDDEGRRAIYGRSAINVQQLMDFCFRKAGINDNGSLTFKEFKSFLRALRNQGDASHCADLVFALFDLDGTNSLDREEFLEIFRYYTGRTPTGPELQKIWGQLDRLDTGEVTKQQYIKWMQHYAPPQFTQHAPPVEGDSESGDSKLAKPSRQSVDPYSRYLPAPGMMPRSKSAATWSNTWHAPWNERFRGRDNSLLNPANPKMLKRYFSAPQTMPELSRFYSTYKGFGKHQKSIHQPPTPRQRFILSNQSQPEICPERARPGGFARNSKGDSVPWNDHWQMTQGEIQKRRVAAGSLLLRLPGKPPPCLTQGRDAAS